MAYGLYADQPAGIELPHPPIPLAVFLIVEQAVLAAWEWMRTHSRPSFDLRDEDEDIVTQELFEVLFDRIFGKRIVKGFDRELFTVVTRESKVRNYDGSELDKMPDLLVGLVGRLHVYKLTQDWLFIECKPVDSGHSVGVHYCGKGIIRFVRGKYAWAMSSALMVGYVAAGHSISPGLNDALKKRQRSLLTKKFPQPCRHSLATSISEQTHISEHDRKFKYIENGKQAPPITIRHLWLKRG